MDFFDVVSKRRSIRKFKDTPLSCSDLDRILDAAMLAPTARNVQPWEFVVVTDKNNIKEIAQLSSPNGVFIQDAAVCIVVCCQDTKYYLEDGCAATTQALLAATALGIGGCWVAGDKKDYCTSLGTFLKIPKNYKIVSLLAFGYPDETPVPVKKELKQVLHEDKF